MAKKDDKSKAKAGLSEASRRFTYYCLVILLVGAVALAWLSLLTFNPVDPPSHAESAQARTVQNAAGTVGAHIAFYLYYWIGGGAYMLLLFATVAACVLIVGGRISDVYWRLLGVALLMVVTSAAIFLLSPRTATPGYGWAGILGQFIGNLLYIKFNRIGSWIVISLAFCTGLMLTADSLVLRVPQWAIRMWQRRKELPEFMSSMRPKLALPSTSERTVTASPRAVAAMPAKAAQKGKPDKPSDNPAAKPDEKPAEKTPEAPRIRVSAAPSLPAPPPEPLALAHPAEPKASDKLAKPKSAQGEPAPAKDAPKPPAPAAPVQAAAQPPKPAPRLVPAKPDRPPPLTKSLFPLPSVDLLAAPTGGYIEIQEQQAEVKRAVLQQTLNDFNVQAEVVGHQTGPVITLFELSLAPGVKVAQVANLANDIARSLAVPGVRIVSPLPGRDTVGVEVPNSQKEMVRIRELMNLAPEADKRFHLPLYLGKDAGGGPIVADLASMPHMLIAGTTGSGKSVCINTIIMSLLMTRTPEDVRLVLVDPKMVEMAAFENVAHLLCPIVNDMRNAENILEWAAGKMDERYEALRECNVKNIAQFNRLPREEVLKRLGVENEEEAKTVPTHLPYYVIIIDELADLVMTAQGEVENHIIRIAQKARAVGIHLILATQRPSVNVVTGLIKSNMPCRISFKVASRQESRIVLDQNGAEILLGQGDMLFLSPGTSALARAQGTFVDDSEIKAVVNALRAGGSPQYETELMKLNSASLGEGSSERDEFFDKAVEIVLQTQRGSVSLLQRRLNVGYSRASRIIDQMAEAGLLGDYKGSQARECMITLEDWQAMQASIHADQTGASAANGEPTSV